MSPSLEEIKTAASGLPTSERADLAHFLLRSLESEEEGWAQAWREELARRLEEIHSGKVTGIPAEDVLARLRENYP